MKLSPILQENILTFSRLLPIGRSFDLITREMRFGRTRVYWMGINGMFNSEVMQLILSDLQSEAFCRDPGIENLRRVTEERMTFGQVSLCSDVDKLLYFAVSGPSVLLVDGFDEAVVIDLRQYPARSIEEPENEKVMRGAKDGFVETMLFNCNLIRRRIRHPQLTFELHQVGRDSKTDVAIAYVDGLASERLLRRLREKLAAIEVRSLTMGAKTLEELLVKKRWWNPMPSMQMTERPDVACSYLMEGNLLLLVDNTPQAIVLPVSFFQFTQSPEDYAKNPLIGGWFRLLRAACVLVSLFLLPLFVAVAGHMPQLSAQLDLLKEEMGLIKLLFFVAAVEFGLDLLQYTSSHALSTLITPISIVGGLLLSDIAIELEWFSQEVIFYGAATLLSTLMISSSAFADALRIYRSLLLIGAGLFGPWGLGGAAVLMMLSVATTPTFAGESYFWPLFPFNFRALKTILLRLPAAREQPENVWKR